MGMDAPLYALARLKDEMAKQRMSQRDIARLLNWSQSKIQKIMAGTVQLTVEDLAAIAWALNLSPVECVRTPGLEFVADLTPSELRLLERLRQLRPDQLQAIATILGVTLAPTVERAPRRKRSSEHK